MSDEPVKRARTLALTPVCRLCASSSEELIQIFSNEGIQKGLPEKVARCLPILISENDDLPTTICPSCSDKLESVRSFFESCFNSNQSLVIRLRQENGMSEEVTDLETQVNMYVRHFSNGPIVSPIKLEPSSYCDVDLSVPEEEEEEELEEEEEEELEEAEEEVEEEEEEEEEGEEESEEMALSDKQEIDSSTHGEFKMPDSTRIPGRRSRGRPRKPSVTYDPYFDDLDIDYNAPSPSSDMSSSKSSSSNTNDLLSNNNGTKEKVAKRGRKPLVSLSLKTCAECGEEFQDHASNLNHWKERHPDKETFYKCTHKGCDFQSKQTDEVNKHRFRHKDRTKLAARNLSTCTVCGKRYPPNYLLTRHMFIHTDTTSNQNCPVCNKLFTNDKDLSEHVKIHGPEDLKYSHCCHYCGKRFTQRANLDAHLRVHSGFKPFSCDFCGKTFSQKGNMEEHRRTHTGEKPYVCELCGFAFARRSELQLHNRCVHTGERPYQCAYCPKNFQRRDLLRKHERIHTDTRPYACEYCAKTFTQRDKMVVHTRLHTGERPYVCEVCGKGFCESGNLKKHLRVHGKEVPKIMHQNNKGKPPPIHPSAFVPTKSEHVFHRHNFPSVNTTNTNNNHPSNNSSNQNSINTSNNNPTPSSTPVTTSATNSNLVEPMIDNRNNETPTPHSVAPSPTLNSSLKCNPSAATSPALRIPSAASSGNVHAASIAAAAVAMSQDLKPSAMDYAFPAVAAAMMQQQQQQHQQQQQQQQLQQQMQQQQMHLTGARTPTIPMDDQSDTASERSVTPSFIQSHHQHHQTPQTPGIPHYAMHGLIQHLSDWSAVYGGHHQLSGSGHGPGGHHGNQ